MFSFTFWKLLRSQGTPDAPIFDLTFYATIAALVAARLMFAAEHRDLFTDNFLKIAAIWVQPGLSLYGGLVGALGTMVYLGRQYKVRLGYILDAWAIAFPLALIVGEIGSFLDGTEIGKITTIPWGVFYIGQTGLRHPVQLYEIGALVVLFVVSIFLMRRGVRRKWPFGLVGVWFFLLYAASMFIVEFAKEGSVYFLRLSLNQWILVGIFAESIGAFYVRGGGREQLRPTLRKLGATLYAKIRRTPTA